jgi:hypothetical protein
MLRVLHRIRFLFTAPFILVFLFLINVLTWNGHWWVQWAALGIGIAWVITLLRVVQALVLMGGLAALGAYLGRRGQL